MLIKTPLLHQSFGPHVSFFFFFLSFFLSLALSLSPSLSLVLADSLECGSWLCNPGNISLFTFFTLIVNSGPPGSGPLKDQQVAPEQGLGARGFGQSDPQGLLRPVTIKTRVNRLESPLTFLLYFSTYLKFRDFWFQARE